tara:strand:+ start:645 stop:1436 length:792 start_codon:yes stop_codon:yes gene_type:complete
VNIFPKKSLGQNFLIDKNIINKIIEVGNIKKDDYILEVGPGTGNLTKEIIKKKPKKIFLIEKDKLLFKNLKKKFNKNINIFNEDILKFEERDLSSRKLLVFGNLPYNISTQILTKWILYPNSKFWFKKLVLMFQKDVAERIVAIPNTRDYGRLSIISNWRLNIKKHFDISKNCFFPKPKVEGSILSFNPKKNYIKFKSPKNLELITRVFFSQKRKMVNKPFKKLFGNIDEVSNKLKINLDLRPQNLNKEAYFKITSEYEKLIR